MGYSDVDPAMGPGFDYFGQPPVEGMTASPDAMGTMPDESALPTPEVTGDSSRYALLRRLGLGAAALGGSGGAGLQALRMYRDSQDRQAEEEQGMQSGVDARSGLEDYFNAIDAEYGAPTGDDQTPRRFLTDIDLPGQQMPMPRRTR